MKFKQKKNTNITLSDKIADALTVKPRPDIEDDHVFGTKPRTLNRADFSSSDSGDDAAISDFRKRNVNLLSEISKKYEGQLVARKDVDEMESDASYEQSGSDQETNNLSTRNLTINDEESSDNMTETEQQNQMKIQETAGDSADFSSDDNESDDYSITRVQKSAADESEQSDGDDEGEGYDISQLAEPMKEEFEHVKKQNVSEEAKRGSCVRNQLLVWEGLLEMRIHLQRCMNTANQMPLPESYDALKKNNEFSEECNTTKVNVANVLDKFLCLQNLLLKNYPETKTLSTNKKVAEAKVDTKEDSDEEIPSDTDNEEIQSDTDTEEGTDKQMKFVRKNDKHPVTIKKRKLTDYDNEITTSHKAFKSFRDATIQKWNDKTRLATATNIKNVPTNTVLQQISYILSDKEKLVRRTQLKRSEYDIIGYEKPAVKEDNNDQNCTDDNHTIKNRKDDDEYISEIFDDSDFYHQLLRELIECKSADISDPVQLSRQWIALQQMRSKMKRKVDTKATKGRKIKYVVHNPLVNYMAPEKCTTWSEESTNELYSSLFGKLYEQNNVGINANVELK